MSNDISNYFISLGKNIYSWKRAFQIIIDQVELVGVVKQIIGLDDSKITEGPEQKKRLPNPGKR